jgi:hypothetical protein
MKASHPKLDNISAFSWKDWGKIYKVEQSEKRTEIFRNTSYGCYLWIILFVLYVETGSKTMKMEAVRSSKVLENFYQAVILKAFTYLIVSF